jgi:type I restriction enzyme S subunit
VNTVPMATNQGFKSFVPKRDTDAKFLYWWLRSNRAYLERLGNGATFKEVSKGVVSRIEISLPPLAEQLRIADVLDRAEALRAKRRASLVQLDSLTQSLFLDLFSDPVSNPRNWPQENLETFFHFKTGKLDSNAAVTSGRYPFFTCSRVDFRIDTFALIARLCCLLETTRVLIIRSSTTRESSTYTSAPTSSRCETNAIRMTTLGLCWSTAWQS